MTGQKRLHTGIVETAIRDLHRCAHKCVTKSGVAQIIVSLLEVGPGPRQQLIQATPLTARPTDRTFDLSLSDSAGSRSLHRFLLGSARSPTRARRRSST